jgi:hypothetical protein
VAEHVRWAESAQLLEVPLARQTGEVMSDSAVEYAKQQREAEGSFAREHDTETVWHYIYNELRGSSPLEGAGLMLVLTLFLFLLFRLRPKHNRA